jgi:hypothetical protein
MPPTPFLPWPNLTCQCEGSTIYQQIKDQSPEEQTEYFRHHAQAGAVAELVAKPRQQESPSRSR